MADLELNFYSRLYDNFFDDEMCDAYIASFEETMKKDAEKVEKTSICTAVSYTHLTLPTICSV